MKTRYFDLSYVKLDVTKADEAALLDSSQVKEGKHLSNSCELI